MAANDPRNHARDDELSVEELESVSGGAEAESNNSNCTEVNIYQCGKQPSGQTQ